MDALKEAMRNEIKLIELTGKKRKQKEKHKMSKVPFVTKAQVEEIAKLIPPPFIYTMRKESVKMPQS